jgi:chitin synthase
MQELTRLIPVSNNTSIYPADNSILSFLHDRFRHDRPYTCLAPSSCAVVVVDPAKHMCSLDNESQHKCKACCYDATDDHGEPSLQPHPYQFAVCIHSFMRCRNQSQAVVFRSVQPPTALAYVFPFRPRPASSHFQLKWDLMMRIAVSA